MRELPEISEAEATGSVAAVYEEIRGALGLPVVMLVWRHLATAPGRLETTWAAVGSNLSSEQADACADELAAAAEVSRAPLAEASLVAVGVDASLQAAVASTLEAYAFANPRNLLAVHALLSGVPGSPDAWRPRRQPTPEGVVLPIGDSRDLAPEVRSLIDEMAAPFSPPGETAVVPSLFRHFASLPGLLALFWTVLEPLVRGKIVARTANVLDARAAALARTLPVAVRQVADPGTREALSRFTFTISRMTVAAIALRDAVAR